MKKFGDQFLFISASLFFIVAILSLFLIFFPISIIIGCFSIPAWFCPASFVVSGVTSGYLFRFSRGSDNPRRDEDSIN